MISERKLRRIRKAALVIKEAIDLPDLPPDAWHDPVLTRSEALDFTVWILQLTQELMDQHLKGSDVMIECKCGHRFEIPTYPHKTGMTSVSFPADESVVVDAQCEECGTFCITTFHLVKVETIYADPE